jgi:hypothetical protein
MLPQRFDGDDGLGTSSSIMLGDDALFLHPGPDVEDPMDDGDV